MFNQTFSPEDIVKVFFLAVIEILLSADNAVILGVLTNRLPEFLRKKALYIGAASAVVIRAIALFSIAFLVRYQAIQVIGATYLIYICIAYFFQRKKRSPLAQKKSHFWQVVVLIEVFDLLFAIDSILAGIAFIDVHNQELFFSKIWIVYLGGVIGLLGIRYSAHLFSTWIDRFPNMQRQAYLMVGWIGLKLAYEALLPPSQLVNPLFWAVLLLFFGLGFVKDRKRYG